MDYKILKIIGGQEFKLKYMHRLYFNSLAKWYGLEGSHKDGYVYNHENIDEEEANVIRKKFHSKKLWYDVKKSKFFHDLDDGEDAFVIVDNIETKYIKFLR